mmetsp:Transcript_32712/g.74774  ORF Transcript_32712/g.74774 Transcript_32712/m.74774 type:complete len:261 (+) Transcript_32712:65-847(+)
MPEGEIGNKCASIWTTSDCMCAPNFVTRSFVCKRGSSLDNTFINLCVQDKQLLRRSGSTPSVIEASCRASADDEPTSSPESSRQDGFLAQETIYTVEEQTEVNNHPPPTSVSKACLGDNGNPTDSRGKAADFTTLILRNLPVDASQASVQFVLRDAGWHGTYDFLYVPARFRDGSCHGYGFVNFSTHQIAFEFMNQWNGNRIFCGPCHRKPLIVDVASTQGIDALMDRRSMRNVRNRLFRPYVARYMRYRSWASSKRLVS